MAVISTGTLPSTMEATAMELLAIIMAAAHTTIAAVVSTMVVIHTIITVNTTTEETTAQNADVTVSLSALDIKTVVTNIRMEDINIRC